MAVIVRERQEEPQPTPPSGSFTWWTTVDHKRIGILYLLTSLVFFIIGGIEALAMRTQLMVPGNTWLSPEVYNQLFTTHGTTMIFWVIMPTVIGFANYFVPLMIGARDMAFARLNAWSYWLFLFGGVLFYFSFIAGGGPNAGWFAYPPLSLRPYSSGPGMDYWALGLLVAGVGSIAGAVNLLVTIVALRARGMTISRIPLFVWSIVATAFLIIWALPTFAAAAAMIVLDRAFGANFFQPRFGGDPILYQHLFWWLGHPEVYIMFLPVTGIISEVIPVFSRKPIFGYGFIAASSLFIAFYSMLVWAHHMLAVGLPLVSLGFFSGASLLVAVPTGVKVFNWLATMYGGAIRLRVAMLFAIGLIVNFTLGGLTGVAVALVPFDWQVTDSYYIVAHLHYVLVGGSLTGIFAGVYYWYPKMTGRLLDERLGVWHFWTTMVGITLTFLPMHYQGVIGMPRRVYTYPASVELTVLNIIETIGAYLLAVSMAIFLWNLWRSVKCGELAGDNPWDAYTLEWATSSPPPAENFAEPPRVRSRFPLWPMNHPDDDDVRAARQGERPLPMPERFGRAVGSMEVHRLGMLLFISSEVVFFAALIITFLVNRTDQGSEFGQLFDLPRILLFSVALFASSGTISLAGRALHRGDWGSGRRWLLITAGLGTVFLIGQLTEYATLVAEGFSLTTGVFGSAFYTLTGFHGVHVLVGIAAMSALWAATGPRTMLGRAGRAFEPIALYWHFVDVVWIAILGLVYVWTVL